MKILSSESNVRVLLLSIIVLWWFILPYHTRCARSAGVLLRSTTHICAAVKSIKIIKLDSTWTRLRCVWTFGQSGNEHARYLSNTNANHHLDASRNHHARDHLFFVLLYARRAEKKNALAQFDHTP